MWKLIFLGLIIWFVIYIFKRAISKSNTSSSTGNQPNAKEASRDTAESSVENMVQCSSCHIHLPRSEAFLVNGHFYCCNEHISS